MIYKFIINGRGGSGKDTFIDIFSQNTELNVYNTSSIDPVKKIAKKFGWNGEKTSKDRKFLADLKLASIEYNDGPKTHVINEIMKTEDYEYLFIHIREPNEIKKIVDLFPDVYTILINKDIDELGNNADDSVYDYQYDIIIDNNDSIEDLEESVKIFMKEIDAG